MRGTLCLDYTGPDAPYRRHVPGLVDPKYEINVLTRIGYDRLVWQPLDGRRSEELEKLIARARG